MNVRHPDGRIVVDGDGLTGETHPSTVGPMKLLLALDLSTRVVAGHLGVPKSTVADIKKWGP